MQIKSIIIGLGKIGMGYDYLCQKKNTKKIISHASAINFHSNFCLSAGVDNNNLKRENFYRKYKVKTFKHYTEAIKKIRPKLIVVSTPIHTHFKILKKIIQNKFIKIILCEKPITGSISNSNKIYKTIKEKNKFFFVNYIREYDPVINKVLENLKKNKSNFPIQINVYYYNGFYNNASHFLLLVSKIFGSCYSDKIKIISVKKTNPIISSSVDFEIKYKKGTVKFFSKNKKNQKIKNELEIITPKKKINFSYRSGKISFFNKKKNRSLNTQINISKYNVFDNKNNYLKKRDKILCSIKDVLKTEFMLHKILKKI
jgi:hypothetical protein